MVPFVMGADGELTQWDAPGSFGGECVLFQRRYDAVTVWAGGELDPVYLTAESARRAADEWPAILRRLADELDATN